MAAARRRAAAGGTGVSGPRMTWDAFAGIVAAPMLITMFLSGLWHGAGNQFLLFGVLHGMALVINHAWRLVRPRLWPDTAHYQRTTRPIAWALTFMVVVVAMTWFRAASVGAGGNIVMGMVGGHGLELPDEMASGLPVLAAALGHAGVSFTGGGMAALVSVYAWIAVLMLTALVPPNALEILRAWQPAVTMPSATGAGRIDMWRGLSGRFRLSLSPLWAVATAVLLTVGVLALNKVSEFLYWQF